MLYFEKLNAVFRLIIGENMWSEDQKENEEMFNDVLYCWVMVFR